MAKRKTMTEVEINDERLARSLRELREGYIPAPTRIFKPGDKLAIGHLDNVVVLHALMTAR